MRLPVLTSRLVRRLALRVLGDPFHVHPPGESDGERRRRLDKDAAAEERRAILLTRTGA